MRLYKLWRRGRPGNKARMNMLTKQNASHTFHKHRVSSLELVCMSARSQNGLPSLVPRPSPAPVFDRLQYAKTEQAIKNWSRGRPGNEARATHVTSHFGLRSIS